MDIADTQTLVTQEVADAVISSSISEVAVTFTTFDDTWRVTIRLNDGITYSLAEQCGRSVMFFKNLRDTLVFLKGAGVTEVMLDMNEWSPTTGNL